jgi:2-iminobutanoate/2-iminopropanoate deaminase
LDRVRRGASDESGKLVGRGDITAQTRKTLDNMKIALAAARATLDDVVKVTIYLADVNDRQKVTAVHLHDPILQVHDSVVGDAGAGVQAALLNADEGEARLDNLLTLHS